MLSQQLLLEIAGHTVVSASVQTPSHMLTSPNTGFLHSGACLIFCSQTRQDGHANVLELPVARLCFEMQIFKGCEYFVIKRHVNLSYLSHTHPLLQQSGMITEMSVSRGSCIILLLTRVLRTALKWAWKGNACQYRPRERDRLIFRVSRQCGRLQHVLAGCVCVCVCTRCSASLKLEAQRFERS